MIEAIADYLFDVVDLRNWWAEWRTRHSPVAFWLAVFTGLMLAAVSFMYLSEAVQSIRVSLGWS